MREEGAGGAREGGEGGGGRQEGGREGWGRGGRRKFYLGAELMKCIYPNEGQGIEEGAGGRGRAE